MPKGSVATQIVVSFIHTFFKPIGLLLGAFNAIALIKLTNIREMNGDTAALQAFVVLIGFLLSVVEIQLLLLCLGDRTYLFSLKERASRLIVGGVALALALAGFLAWQERSGHDDQEARQRQDEAEMRRWQSGPDIGEAVKMVERLRERAATRPAASQPGQRAR